MEEILILGVLGGLAYLFFKPAGIVQPSITALLSPTGTPVSTTPGTIVSAPPVSNPVRSPGTTIQSSAQALIAQQCGSSGAKGCGFGVDTTEVEQLFETSINSGYLMWPPPSAKWQTQCTGATTSQTAQSVMKIGGVGVTAAGAAAGIPAIAAVLPALGPAALIAAPILAVVGVIFAHHQKAIQMQSNVLCENVPAANAAFQQIDAGLGNGTITAAAAIAAYQSLQSGFNSAMRSDPSYKKGDAMDAYNRAMMLVVAARTAALQGAN